MNVTLYQHRVTLRRRVHASAQDHRERTRLLLRVESSGVAGFGEVAPQPQTLNGDPGLEEVLRALDDAVALVGSITSREGQLPPWGRVARLSDATPARNSAWSLLEMALLDLELKRSSTSITSVWRPLYSTPSQATVSLLDDETEWFFDDHVTRLRVKSAPGVVSSRALERLRALEVPVIVDFNCSANNDDEVLEQVNAIGAVATIDAVEQPFAVGNLIDHARLATRLDVPLSLDESVRSMRDLTYIANYDAARMICVKPARVGGLANARGVITRAHELDLKPYLGGFFESPYARCVHRALARSCVSEPSDIDDVILEPLEQDAEVTTVLASFGCEPSSRVLGGAASRTKLAEFEP